MSVTVLAEPTKPESVAQTIPVTPVICQVPVPVIAGPFVGPWMVAVKVIVEPNVALEAFALTETLGVYCGTVVVTVAAVLPIALYVKSVAALNVAP